MRTIIALKMLEAHQYLVFDVQKPIRTFYFLKYRGTDGTLYLMLEYRPYLVFDALKHEIQGTDGL